VGARLTLNGPTVDLDAGAGAVTVGSWHHLAATWDGATLRAYVDGTEVGNVAASGLLGVGPAMTVTLGNVATADRGIDGVIDEVRVEGVARSPAWLAAASSNQRIPGAFAVAGAVQAGSWLDQGDWTFRKPIAVEGDTFSADVTDFPLLVEVIDPEVQSAALASGLDLVFTDADGTTRLDHVIESYDGATGAVTAWVRLPTVTAGSPTALFIYYGNPTAADQQDPEAVFGADADLTLLFGG